MTDLVGALAGRLVVSCQAYPGEPMRDPRTMSQVARACVAGGAAAIRVQGLEDIRATVAAVDVPVIGLVVGFVLGVYAAEVRRVGEGEARRTTVAALKAVGLSILIELVAGLLATVAFVVGVVLT